MQDQLIYSLEVRVNEVNSLTVVNPISIEATEVGNGDTYKTTVYMGVRGPKGDDGADGSVIHEGTGAPGAGLGNDGDYYLDKTLAPFVWQYGPKTGGAWGDRYLVSDRLFNMGYWTANLNSIPGRLHIPANGSSGTLVLSDNPEFIGVPLYADLSKRPATYSVSAIAVVGSIPAGGAKMKFYPSGEEVAMTVAGSTAGYDFPNEPVPGGGGSNRVIDTGHYMFWLDTTTTTYWIVHAVRITDLKKYVGFAPLVGDSTALSAGDGQGDRPAFYVDKNIAGMQWYWFGVVIPTAGTGGVHTIMVRRVRAGVSQDLLTTAITVDANETDSKDAVVPLVLNASHLDLEEGDLIYFDLDGVPSGPGSGLHAYASAFEYMP